MTTSPWRALVVGADAQAVLATVGDVVLALDDAPPVVAHELALAHAYCDAAAPNQGHRERAIRLLETAIGRVSDEPMTPALFGGLVGVGWIVQHLQSTMAIGGVDDDFFEGLADHIDAAEATGWPFDLVSGLAGAGLLALERGRGAAAERLVRIVLDRLERLAQPEGNGCRWLTVVEQLTPEQRLHHPHGRRDLGVAHGIAGVIALLARIHAADVERPRALALLEQAVTWLMAQRLRTGSSAFGYVAGDDRPARSGWCYGDPGIAVMLLQAAHVARRDDWLRFAVEIARQAARRPPEETGVRDASLCHGAAGLMHLFNRLGQATGEPEFDAAARLWLQRAMALRQHGQRYGGYARWQERERAFSPDPSLLSGAAGVALALLAASTPHEPAWDRMLALSLPSNL